MTDHPKRSADVRSEALRHVAAVIVSADGRIDSDETTRVTAVLSELTSGPYTSTELDDDLIRFDRAGLSDHLRTASGLLDEADRILIVRVAIDLAAADGDTDAWELDAVREIGDALGVSQADVSAAIASGLHSPDKPSDQGA